MEQKIKIFEQETNKNYNAEDLKNFFDDYKTVVKYESTCGGIKTAEFMVLNQQYGITIKGYPYGYKKTLKNFYVETNKKGGRLVGTTLNPITERWNKPKKSTYDDIKLLVVNSKGYISSFSCDMNSHESIIKLFETTFYNLLSEQQKVKFAQIKAFQKVMENVTFEVNTQHYKHRETGKIETCINIMEMNQYDKCTPDGGLINEKKEQEQEQETNKKINNAIAHETNKELKDKNL